MIKISSLSFRYPESSTFVLKDINLSIQPGTLTLVTGASGTGKSTLLRCINGLIPHFSGGVIKGEIDVFGSDPIREGPKALAKKVGFVFQEPEAQFVFDIVEDEIAFIQENMGISYETMHTSVNQILDRMKIAHLRGMNVNKISGGEKQKVAIASVLVNQPRVLILDEPTSQLDPQSADEMLQLITSLKEDLGLTIILSEHRLERLLPFTDNMIDMNPGAKKFFGAPQTILPDMEQVPPLIEISRRMNISPLPLSPQEFSKSSSRAIKPLSGSNRKPKTSLSGPILEMKNIRASLDGKQILSDVSFHLQAGEILTLMGLNGAGKTTLIRCAFGLIPCEGKRRLFGKNVGDMSLTEIIRNVAYLPQNPNDLLFAESVLDELKVTLKNFGLTADPEDLSVYLEKLGLGGKEKIYPRDLSVGERQRTALAAVTVHDPKIIIMDEPTRGLDYLSKQAISKILGEWREQGKAVLVVTHDIEFAAGISSHAIILEGGKIIYDGSPAMAFSDFPPFQTQIARLFPGSGFFKMGEIL